LSALGAWPTPQLARGEHADVWGLYHSPPANAIGDPIHLGAWTTITVRRAGGAAR